MNFCFKSFLHTGCFSIVFDSQDDQMWMEEEVIVCTMYVELLRECGG